MSPPLNSTHDIWENIAPELRKVVESHLADSEMPLVWLEIDLDQKLLYAWGLLVLSDRRILSVGPVDAAENDSAVIEKTFQSWPVDSALTLRAREYAGTGMLDLTSAESRLHHWRFTSGKSTPHIRCRCGSNGCNRAIIARRKIPRIAWSRMPKLRRFTGPRSNNLS